MLHSRKDFGTQVLSTMESPMAMTSEGMLLAAAAAISPTVSPAPTLSSPTAARASQFHDWDWVGWESLASGCLAWAFAWATGSGSASGSTSAWFGSGGVSELDIEWYFGLYEFMTLLG